MTQLSPKGTMIVGGITLVAAGLYRLFARRADLMKPKPDEPAGPASVQLQGVKWIGLFLAVAGGIGLVIGLGM